jgi:subtilisin family serine protease
MILMKKEVISLCAIAMTLLSLFIVTTATAGSPPPLVSTKHARPSSTEYVQDEVLVRFNPEARKDDAVMPDIAAAVHSKVGATAIEEFKWVPGLQLVKLPKGVTVPDAVALYRQNPTILYAEPNYIRHEDTIPNDPYFSALWGLHNTGQVVRGERGTPGADVKAPEAWDNTTGSSDVVVAVLDTGVDYNEPDLAPNIMKGYDFIMNNTDPMDRNGHGTHVAGIIAAAGNNGIGVTGVMWNAKIMPVRFLGPSGGTVSDEIASISYASSHGATIINMSYGGSQYSQAEKDAIDASQAICVCAAGNNGMNTDVTPSYPASYKSSNIISVAATDQNDALASFSNYGPNSVQVAAPGTNIYSTNPPWVQMFYDPFNNLTAWDAQAPWNLTNAHYVSSPPSAMVSSPGGDILNASLTLKNPLDLTNKCGTTLEFYARLNATTDHDRFYVEASRDNVTWDTIDSLSGNSNGWTFLGYSLTNYDTSPYLNIRCGLTTDGSEGSSSVYLDNVKISAFDPSSTEQNYVFFDGTSMATPYVSGLAGLVKAMNFSYSPPQIREALLKNVDVKSSLSGKILTGGRINASKTLSRIVPTPAPSFSITSAQLVPSHPHYFEWGITNAGTADAWIAPYAILYKQTAAAPGYARDGDAVARYARDDTTGNWTTAYHSGGYDWFNARAGHTYRFYSGPVVPADVKWAVYNAQLYYDGASQGWLHANWDKYVTLR